MARTTITFSLPPEMAARVNKLMEQEGRTRSELLRDALLRYIEESEWRRVLRYGERRARERGIGPADVEPLVDEYRAGADAAQA